MTDKNNGVLVVVEVLESQPVDLVLDMLDFSISLTDVVPSPLSLLVLA